MGHPEVAPGGVQAAASASVASGDRGPGRTYRHLSVAPRPGRSIATAAPSDPGGSLTSGEQVSAAQAAAVTAEELAILALLASGLPLDSVAIRMALSPRTVSRRLRYVCDRLGLRHPIQSVVWAARRGLI
jgi:DNA-binding NarL/FixJ family response regulator